ncbi:MAG TPA: polyprenyl diphosphate synthase [Gaiellaceae bacterium]|jgi:undecaprenyl diphosphate synthase
MLGLRTRLRALRILSLAMEKELPTSARSVAIIMDGNGRWARRHGLPVASGHRAGTRALRRTVETCLEVDVRSLAVFAFSTENWSRPKDEIDALMMILAETIEKELPDLAEQGVRTRFVGRRDRIGDDLRQAIEKIESATADKKRLDLWIAFDYGGRSELVEATREMLRAGVDPNKLDEEVFTSFLSAPEMPDPDLLIRTSGESRVSNFLLWQIAYTELAFVEKLWPEFGPADLRAALQAYTRRRRRFGGR